MELYNQIASLPHLHMWVTFALIAGGIYLYATERFQVEVTSLILFSLVFFFFYAFPYNGPDGKPLLTLSNFLRGFSDPALIAVMCLLVISNAVVRHESLNWVTNIILKVTKNIPFLAVSFTILLVILTSTVVNDTPTCVMYIPIMMAVARQLKISASKVMIPVSYASILGGTTTLIGSSTNLVVAGAVVSMGLPAIGFFDFTLPGVLIALVGFLYIIFVLPYMLPNRAPLASGIMGDGNRQFVAQLEVATNSPLIGSKFMEPNLFGEEDIKLRMVQRGEHAFLPPFDEHLVFHATDILIVTATRQAINTIFADKSKPLFREILETSGVESEELGKKGDVSLTEIMIGPGSRMVGLNIEQIGFHHNYHCIVLGIQRRARTITSRMTDIRLAAGDVLLVMASQKSMQALRDSKDVLVMEWATQDIPNRTYSRRIGFIFGAVILCSAIQVNGDSLVPIHIGAFIGATAAILTGCLNLRQAKRALDSQIIMLVAVGFALSAALQETGGALYLAQQLIDATMGMHPAFVMSALFLLMALFTNFLSNNATALLFTPIAVNTAQLLGVPPEMFIYAVIFACNCCDFATPIGFQTNLLVMAPGHYRFGDYIKAGLPLVFLVWITYTTFSYFYF